MKRPPTMPPMLDEDAVEAIRNAKRKHTPEAVLQALEDAGWILVRSGHPVNVDGGVRWRVLIDDVFATAGGVVDCGGYEDMDGDDAIELGGALIAAGRYVNGDVE